MSDLIVGIDLGKKLAGTTALCYLDDNHKPCWEAADKNQDADHFIINRLGALMPKAVFLDAPLSLPGIYRFGLPYDDYFYRTADRVMKAMSPMFLAGLTARAIRLKDNLAAKIGCAVYEAYPKGMANKLSLHEHDYKGSKASISQITAFILSETGCKTPDVLPRDWHQVDALLALTTGLRRSANCHERHGDPEEGYIYV